MRLLFGLDRIPRTLAFDDPRLPGVTLDRAPLRLNTVPVPPAVLGDAGDGHAARLDAMRWWLQAQCGDYAVGERTFVAEYMATVEAEVEAHRAELAAGLQRFRGLYAVEDWIWSAFRPLPRAWWLAGGIATRLGMVFWDGQRIIPAEEMHVAEFWRAEGLPCSPFRRLPVPLTL